MAVPAHKRAGFDFGMDDLDATTQHVLHQHAREISAHGAPNTQPAHIRRRAHALHAFLYFAYHAIARWVFALLTSPQTVVADPVGAVFALLVLPVIHAALLAVQLLFLAGRLLGAERAGAWFSEEYAGGLTAVNMVDPTMFDDSVAGPLVAAAAPAFANPLGLPVPASQDASYEEDTDPDAGATRYFNLDIAKVTLILCALVYERDDAYVTQAGELAKRADPGVSLEEQQAQIAQLLLESARHITWQAAQWGLNFSSITDFISLGGPFCGLFWPKNGARWIVLTFKGTSPTNFSEFMVDATIVHADAQSFFGAGNLHAGFYAALAPGVGSAVDPYGNILRSVKHVARSLRKDGGEKINLWITGHSLGSAIASLLHARLLMAPKDLGEDIVLRQGYMYGTPRIADADFISAFDFAASTPFAAPASTSQALWRVIDRWDAVTHVPPGLADDASNRGVLPKTSLLNYGHFGTAAIRLTGASPAHPSGAVVSPASFRGGAGFRTVEARKPPLGPAVHGMGNPQEEAVDGTGTPRAKMQPKTMDVLGMKVDPIAVLRRVMPWGGPMADHIPSNYYARLMQVKPDLVIDVDVDGASDGEVNGSSAPNTDGKGY